MRASVPTIHVGEARSREVQPSFIAKRVLAVPVRARFVRLTVKVVVLHTVRTLARTHSVCRAKCDGLLYVQLCRQNMLLSRSVLSMSWRLKHRARKTSLRFFKHMLLKARR